jgi:ABC-type multidrug transport system fused ATPase/permease subunit
VAELARITPRQFLGRRVAAGSRKTHQDNRSDTQDIRRLGLVPARTATLLAWSLISFSNIHKQYGKQLLFVDASFQLNPGEKVGLVGPNGSGKTTLFRMIVGEEAADEGEVSVPKRLTIGYFRQDVEEMQGRSTRPSPGAAAPATCITSSKRCNMPWKIPRRLRISIAFSRAMARCRRNTTISAATR